MNVEIVTEQGECLYSGIDGLAEVREAYSESLQVISEGKIPKNCLKITLPVGYVDKETANGNFYEMVEMNKSLKTAKPLMEQGLIHGANGEHPKDRADLRPDEISHLVMKAWVDSKTKLIWNEWLVVPTDKGGGADLAKLFLAGASIGASIRGTAVRENDKYMRHYTYKGTDCVAIPSTGIRPGINNENLRARITVESFSESVFEGVLAMGGSEAGLSDEIKLVSETLKNLSDGSKAVDLISLGSRLGALEAQITVMESSGETKDTQIGDLRTKIDELKTLKESLGREREDAVKESTSYKRTVDDLRDQIGVTEAELERKSTSLGTAVQALEELRDRYKELEVDVETGGDMDMSVDVIEDLRDYALTCEEILTAARDYILGLEEVVEDVRDYALVLEITADDLVESHDDKEAEAEGLLHLVAELRDKLKGSETKKPTGASMESYVNLLLNKHPRLKVFSEELKSCGTIAGVNGRVKKYLDIVDKSGSSVFSDTMEKTDTVTEAKGIERYIRHLR